MANILICDDESNIRKSINNILSDEGHTVYEAESGLKGLSICRENKIDIAIIDIWMPGLTGTDMLEKINEMESDIVTIIISGHERSDESAKLIEKSAFYFMEKPFSLDSLLDVVYKALKHKKK
ncbi:MAG: response regulator [Spirochaetes bacterium]|nr:response regulator [Spirochaetota bacterium]